MLSNYLINKLSSNWIWPYYELSLYIIFVIYCCLTNYPQTKHLKTTNIYYLPSFWALLVVLTSDGSFHEAAVKSCLGSRASKCSAGTGGSAVKLHGGWQFWIPQRVNLCLATGLPKCPYELAARFPYSK